MEPAMSSADNKKNKDKGRPISASGKPFCLAAATRFLRFRKRERKKKLEDKGNDVTTVVGKPQPPSSNRVPRSND